MIPLHRLLVVELFKLRHTLALFVALVLPGVIALLYALMIVQRGKAITGSSGASWNNLIEVNLGAWTLLGMTLFIALESALVVGIEHHNGGWKRLFAAPLDAGRLFLAKAMVVFALVVVSLAALWCWTVVFGNAVALFAPGDLLAAGAPDAHSLLLLARVACASLLVVAIHVAIAAYWPAIAVSLGSGIVAMIGLVIAASSQWMRFYPWFFPVAAAQTQPERMLADTTYLVSAIFAALLLWLVALRWQRRDVP